MPSIYNVDPSDIETFTIVTNPIRTYVSSSTRGVTGSLYVFAQRSTIEKDSHPDSSFVESAHDDSHLAETLQQAQRLGLTLRNDPSSSLAFLNMMEQYLSKVNAASMSRRRQQVLDVNRFVPPAQFGVDTVRKWTVKDTLQNYYITSYPTAHWAYTNYNSLNFFTASCVPTSSVLLYPNIDGGAGGLVFHENHVSGTYTPSGSFSFDFYLNPRYQPDARDGAFKAGCILHLSGCYALSLVSGSSRDVNGRPVGFRLQLQLSQSANIPPSRARPGLTVNGTPGDLVFLSDDNSLWHNHWHHVVVRWGTSMINAGTGTFNVDGVDVGSFVVPSSSIVPRISSLGNPDVLCVGNYYEGSNTGTSTQALFFAADPAERDGLHQLVSTPAVDGPLRYAFNHPLNAEVHDLAIRRRYLSDLDIASSASVGPTFLDNTFAFYLPPFFVEESPYRKFVGNHGGVLVTPFQEVDGSTRTPFGVALSFGVGGHHINLENFVRDFASNVFPRLHDLTASALAGTTTLGTANQFLYNQPSVFKRNLTILPCDDGTFVPSYQLLASETLSRAVDDLGVEELSFIQLNDMVHTATLLFGGGTFDDGVKSPEEANYFSDLQTGHTPESPFASPGPAFNGYVNTVASGSDVEAIAPLSIYQRTQDGSSNQVTFFDLSNLFYGFRIKPGSLRLIDPDIVRSSLVGSNMAPTSSWNTGPVKVTLADDGRGNVYRADCYTSQSSWNSVGNVYYDEGVIVVKSPHVFFFGNEEYDLEFKGEQHVHVMKVHALAPNNQLNSSSNPNYRAMPLTAYPNDPDPEFVYITGINLHDRDYNVVMKSQLAQPIAKRTGDKIAFKIKYDF